MYVYACCLCVFRERTRIEEGRRQERINKSGDHRIANVSKRDIFFSEDDREYARASRRETFQKVAEDREVVEMVRTRVTEAGG